LRQNRVMNASTSASGGLKKYNALEDCRVIQPPLCLFIQVFCYVRYVDGMVPGKQKQICHVQLVGGMVPDLSMSP